MEIEGEDGSKLILKAGSAKAVFGRGSGFATDDLTVSRRHVSFELKPRAVGTESSSVRVSFEVLGRNPIWVRTQTTGKVRTFRRSETGEVTVGDRFCVSGQRPVWFTLNRRSDEAAKESVSESEIGLDSVDVSEIDPVKEFGFLVIGREFDAYPKNRLRDIKQWEWFLEEPRKGNDDSDDDEEDAKGKRASGRKRRREKGNEDEDWRGESEEDKEMKMKTRRVEKPTYSTRSKDTRKGVEKRGSGPAQRKQGAVAVEDEDDETLGAFIVSDEEAELEEEEESGEEEEDFEEDEDEEE